MSIKHKVLLTIAVTVACLAIILRIFVTKVIENKYAALEKTSVERDMQRFENQFDAEIAGTAALTRTLSEWDDAYQFAVGNNPQFPQRVLVPETYAPFNVNFIVFVNANREIYHISTFKNLTRDTIAKAVAGDLTRGRLAIYNENQSKSSLAVIGGEIMSVAVRPVLDTHGMGPMHGYVMLAKSISPEEIEQFSRSVMLDVSVWRPDGEKLPADVRKAFSILSGGKTKTFITQLNPDLTAAYRIMYDYRLRPVLMLKITDPRDILIEIRRMQRLANYATGVITLIAMGIFWLMLQRIVVLKIEKISRAANIIAESDSVSSDLEIGGNDEIASLSRALGKMVGNLRDTQRAIEENLLFMQLLIDTVPVPVCYTDACGVILGVNRAFTEFFGISRDALSGRTAIDILPAPLAGFLSESAARRIGADSVSASEISRIVINNAECSVIAYASPYSHGGGSFEGVIASVLDITELKSAQQSLQKQNEILETLVKARTNALLDTNARLSQEIADRKVAESALRDETNLLRTILEGIPDAVIIQNTTREIVYRNSACDRMTDGFVSQGVLASKCHQIVFASDTPCEDCVIDKAIESRSVLAKERFVKAAGKWIETRTIPVFDEAGALIHVVKVVRDITERKLDEDHREHIQHQLLQAQKMESIALLASGVAHEFNNMVSIILGSADLAVTKLKRNLEAYREIERIHKAAVKAKDITSSLLSFARINKPSTTLIMPEALMESAVTLCEQLETHNLRITHTIAPDTPAVSADITQITQVILNLVGNARDAMPGGGAISITMSPFHSDGFCPHCLGSIPVGDYCMITVRDSGQGVPDEIRDKLFEPFFTTKGPGRGTGLGLSVSRGIVESHNGIICLESSPGKGTAIHVILPAATHCEYVFPPVESTSPECRVILVDDDDITRGFIAGTLSSANIPAIVATSRQEAVESYLRHVRDISLIIINTSLINADSREVYYEFLRLNPSLQFVTYSTGSDTEAVSRVGFDLGENSHIKNVLDDQTKLITAIKNKLAQGQSIKQ